MAKQTNNLQGEILHSLDPVIGFMRDYPISQSLAILLLALLFAYLVRSILGQVVGRFVQHTAIQWDDKLITHLRRPLFFSVIYLGVLTAMLPLKLSDGVTGILHSIIATLFVLTWTGFIAQLMRLVLQSMSNTTHDKSLVRPQTRPLFENLGFIVILIVAVYLIFRSWNIDMTAWLASAGILGIAIGFAAKDTLANLFSGVFILADSPYKLGDYVVLDSGERGKVTAIGLRSTRLLTRDDVEITIPNAIMGNTRVINESGGPHVKFRIRTRVGVAYGSDIDKVKALLLEIGQSEPQTCADPEPRVRFRTFGASSLDLDLLCWVNDPEERGRVIDALNTTIYKRFRQENVEIPYSKHDLYIKEMPASLNQNQN